MTTAAMALVGFLVGVLFMADVIGPPAYQECRPVVMR